MGSSVHPRVWFRGFALFLWKCWAAWAASAAIPALLAAGTALGAEWVPKFSVPQSGVLAGLLLVVLAAAYDVHRRAIAVMGSDAVAHREAAAKAALGKLMKEGYGLYETGSAESVEEWMRRVEILVRAAYGEAEHMVFASLHGTSWMTPPDSVRGRLDRHMFRLKRLLERCADLPVEPGFRSDDA